MSLSRENYKTATIMPLVQYYKAGSLPVQGGQIRGVSIIQYNKIKFISTFYMSLISLPV